VNECCTRDPTLAEDHDARPYPPRMNLADFSEHLVIRLPHTDAAGVIFYPRIFEIEEELF